MINELTKISSHYRYLSDEEIESGKYKLITDPRKEVRDGFSREEDEEGYDIVTYWTLVDPKERRGQVHTLYRESADEVFTRLTKKVTKNK